MINPNKIHIKHLFVYKRNADDRFHDIGILTDNNDYVEYTIEIQLDKITWYLEDRFRQIFRPFFLDRSSDVMLIDNISTRAPIYMYFMILRQHIMFDLQQASLEKVFSRLSKKYSRKIMTKAEKIEEKRCKKNHLEYQKVFSPSDLKRVWSTIVKLGTCPWISNKVEDYIKTFPINQERRRKIIRLCLLYMLVKKYYCNKNKMIALRHQQQSAEEA